MTNVRNILVDFPRIMKELDMLENGEEIADYDVSEKPYLDDLYIALYKGNEEFRNSLETDFSFSSYFNKEEVYDYLKEIIEGNPKKKTYGLRQKLNDRVHYYYDESLEFPKFLDKREEEFLRAVKMCYFTKKKELANKKIDLVDKAKKG